VTALTKKDTLFKWSPTCQNAFEILKRCYTLPPILCHFYLECKIVIETDTSNLVAIGILSQQDKRILDLVAYFSRKHSPVEMNYEIYDKELLVVICAFKEWHPMLEGSPDTIEVISDHRNLKYFTTK
jgi:hypothetical protein